jgi:hypothetical protein
MDIFDGVVYVFAAYGLYDLLYRYGVIDLLVKEMKHRRGKKKDSPAG